VQAFLHQNPDINIELEATDRLVDLIEEGFDLAVRFGPMPESTLIARKLTTLQLMLCASPDYLARRGTPTSIEELDEFDFATDTDLLERQHHSEEMFLNFCRAVSSLPVHCRRVFILKKVYGLSQKEIASLLGIASSTVEKHIARGMVVTAEYLRTAGYTDFMKTNMPRAKTASAKAREQEQAS
jgi:RNA polymerase sigma factor (sigma-70 family)